MISIPYGKLFYLQAACQTKQQKKTSSVLGRNKILKNKMRTLFFLKKKKKKKVCFGHLRELVYHRECDVDVGLRRNGEKGGGAGVQEKRKVTMGRCTTQL